MGANGEGEPADVAAEPSLRDRAHGSSVDHLAATASPGGPGPTTDGEPDLPTRIGRHTILGVIGAGAMGRVFAAYDPELDRKIAIKLLRAGAQGESESAGRMLREAQALAKVSHPNVIAIFDVGLSAGGVYIAMELVEGTSLGDWLAARPIATRDWQATLDLFLQAGRGLAAAHSAGLVHRDFKPDNVLVGVDGRVRVVDFGLARGVGHADPEPRPPTSSGVDPTLSTSGLRTSRGSLLEVEITRAGALIGTPAYMPPEHLDGRTADARGDQFAFCVALWEALYGVRPFGGDSLATHFEALLNNRRREAPAERRRLVPERIHGALVRGLAPLPEARWPSMEALLAALAPPATTRRGWALVGLLLAALAVALAWRAGADAQRCEGAELRLAGVWDAARRDELRANFAANAPSYAQRSADLAVNAFDRWTEAWSAMRRDACEATHVRGEQSEQLLDLRMACLDRQLARVQARIDLLARGNAEIIEQTTLAVAHLADLGECADGDRLRGEASAASDPDKSRRIATIEARLERADALTAARLPRQSLAELDTLAADIADLNWPPTTIHLALARGQILTELDEVDAARTTLLDAASRSIALGDPRSTAQALVALAWTMRRSPPHFDEMERWSTLAFAELDRAADTLGRARLLRARGRARWERGRYDEAIREYASALQLLEAALGPDHVLVAESRGDQADVLIAKGDTASAREILIGNRAIYVSALGPDHPRVADVDNALGGLAWRAGHYDEALEYFRRALDLRERAYGREHRSLAALVGNIGAALAMKGDFTAARDHFRRAVDLLRPEGGDRLLLANHLGNLASAESKLGRVDHALPLLREALEVRRGLLGEDHPDVALPLANLGEALIRAGQPAEARELLERALALREGVDVQLHIRARVRWQLAEALARLGDVDRVPALLADARADYHASGHAGRERDDFEAAAQRLLARPRARPR